MVLIIIAGPWESDGFLISLLLVADRHKLTVFYLKSFDMDSVQVGKAVFGKEIHTTLGIEPRTNSNPGRYGNPYSVCWFKKKTCGHSPLNPSKVGHPWLPTIRLRADTILNP